MQMAYYLESLSFIIISRFQKVITLFKMLQDFTFRDFDEIVTNMKYIYFGFNLAGV